MCCADGISGTLLRKKKKYVKTIGEKKNNNTLAKTRSTSYNREFCFRQVPIPILYTYYKYPVKPRYYCRRAQRTRTRCARTSIAFIYIIIMRARCCLQCVCVCVCVHARVHRINFLSRRLRIRCF